jgi:ribosomal protein L16 Arg81 hydroxylase
MSGALPTQELDRFPTIGEARPLEAVLEPGDIVYIPRSNVDAVSISQCI